MLRIRRPRALVTVAAAALAVAALLATSVAPTPASALGPVTMTPALQAQIDTLLTGFVAEHHVVGMSAAVVTPDPAGAGPVITTFSYGTPSLDVTTPVDASTQFELGSESKVFTADLLEYLVADGRVALDDRVQAYAPAGTVVPVWVDPDTGATRDITLRDLATHQSGFPDLPPNWADYCGGTPPCNEWRENYTRTDLWTAVANQPPLLEPGTTWLYSNFGFGLLGTILADVMDTSTPKSDPPAYQQALDDAFLVDLGLTATELEQVDPNLAVPYFRTQDAPLYNHFAGTG